MELLTVKELALQLRVSKSTVQRWITEGHLPHYKLGKRSYRLDKREVDEWLKSQRDT